MSEVKKKTDKVKEVEVSADLSAVVTEMKEMISELKEKQAVKTKKALRDAEITDTGKDKAKAKTAKKINKSAQFLDALVMNDTRVIREISGVRAKALNEAVGSAGGYLVPEEFESGVHEYLNDYSQIRKNATVMPMSSDTKRLNELTSAVTVNKNPAGGVGSRGELGTITGSQNVYGEPVLTLDKYVGISNWSYEVREDAATELNIIRHTQQRFAEAIAQKEQETFISGLDSGSEGLLTVAGVTVANLLSGTTFSEITYEDLAAMQVALFGVTQSREPYEGKFYMSQTVYNSLRTSTGSDAHFRVAPPVPTDDAPASAWGLGIVTLNQFPSATATGTKFVVFSDLKKHGFIGDRAGIRVSLHNEGTIVEAGGSTRNLLTTDGQAVRVVKRTAWTTALQDGIVTLATN